MSKLSSLSSRGKTMKEQTKMNLLLTFLVINLTFLSFLIGLSLGTGDISFDRFTTKEISNCNFTTVQEASLCLVAEQKTFYNYNISNLDEKLTEDELKTSGGVCWHYSEWYVNKANQLGLFAKRVDFFSDKTRGHAVAIIYDANLTEYCLVDQTALIGCASLGNSIITKAT